LLLGGCAATEAVRVERIDVAVPVPCIKDSDIPPIPPTAMRKDGDLRANAAGAAADVYALQAYAERANALLRACATN
jgi:hypothetical protein